MTVAPTTVAPTLRKVDVPTLRLDPPQGMWTLANWLALPDDAPRCELVEGCLELLPMPTKRHHFIQRLLFKLFEQHVSWRCIDITGGKIATGDRSGRVPDLHITLEPSTADLTAQLFERPDIIVEVVSAGTNQRHRDFVEKLAEYAAIGIREYWVVDVESETIVVFSSPNENGQYERSKTFERDSFATSELLDDLRISVTAIFDEGSSTSNELPIA